ncbi:MAG TPA: HAD family hydrolase [Methanomicrobia archaeon]|nr:HAD family hydrolase [Methanomicrobia archaeon]
MATTYQLVLLDMDGTFLDSHGKGRIPNEWAYEAFKKSLGHFGLALSIPEINAQFLQPLRAEGADGVRAFCARFRLVCDEFWARRETDVIEAKIDAIRNGKIMLCASAEEIIRYLSERYSLAVVSDAQQASVDFTLEYFNLKSYFTVWFGRKSSLGDLDIRKPNPYYINRVLQKLAIPQEAAILADDSPVGVLAAKRAGIDSVLITHDDDEKRKQCESEPTAVVNNIGELRKVL